MENAPIDNTLVYAACLGGLLFLLVLFPLLRSVCPLALQLPILYVTRYISPFFARHLTHRTLIRRRKFMSRWSWTKALVVLFYFGVNILCLFLRFPGADQVGLRAGTLSLINMMILYTSPHLSFISDALGMSLDTYRHVHSSAGLMSFVLAAFHATMGTLNQGALSLQVPRDLFALIVRIASPPSQPEC